MKILLIPRAKNVYGQDFFNQGLLECCSLKPCRPAPGGNYAWEPGIDLVVSQNLDEEIDAQFISELPEHVLVVAHLHCQWGYLSRNQQDLIRLAMPRVAMGIVPATFLAKDLKSLFPDTAWKVVLNGVDPNRFHPATRTCRRAFRKKIGVPNQAMLIGFVGRLENSKGVQVLEFIAGHLADLNAHLVVQYLDIKDNRSTRKYRQCADRLLSRYGGRLHVIADGDPRSDRPIKYFDVLLHPSLSEVNPLVVLEALMSGVPVAGTRCTPCYQELEGLDLVPGCMSWIDIPGRIHLGMERSELNLNEHEVAQLGNRLLRELHGRTPPDEQSRGRLASRAEKAGLSSDVMHARLNAVYEQVLAG